MKSEFANDLTTGLTTAFDLVKINAHNYCNNQNPPSYSNTDLTDIGSLVGAVFIVLFITFVFIVYCF